MTKYEVERVPGDGSGGFRVVAVNGENRRPFLTKFPKFEDCVDEMKRLMERDAAIRQGVKDGFGKLTTRRSA